MKAIKKIVLIFSNFRLVRELISFLEYGYLRETGWLKSYGSSPQDYSGNPLPWLTLPFIHFVNGRLNSKMTVFEYGSGSSTRYFSGKVKKVYSVEHDREWYEKVNITLADNCDLYYKELDKGYVTSIEEVNIQFDIILVDGRKRVACIKSAVDRLNGQGVLVLDNSEREAYKEGIDFMLNKGFKKIDFYGIPPGMITFGCTSVFYRDGNCLNI